jgi:hypothetical protein
MKRSNNFVRTPLLALLLLASILLLGAAGCSTMPGNIGIGLPSVDTTTGAFLVDTLTLRASTVLRDSVITSNSQYLLAGRYTDPQLGTIKASSYTTLGLGAAFLPASTQIADSVVLVLPTDAYRYGDTTKTQTLLEIHELSGFIPLTKFGFASPSLTSIAGNVNPTLLNNPVVRRARGNLGSLRLRLNMSFGQRLMNDAKSGRFTTQDQLDARYPGLALLPGTSDDAALLRFNASAASLILYYHDPADVTTALNYSFTLNRHFYQAEAMRSGPLAALTTTNRQLDAAKTGQQTYIEGLLGLQTKIEIPYLFDLRNYGQNLVITNAQMIVEAPANTLLNRNLPPPASLSVSTTDVNNRVGTTFVTSALYSPTITTVDNRTQGGYSWSMLNYVQNVLNNSIVNGGILLNTATPTQPDRVILGGPRNTTNKIKLRLYLISHN